MTQRDCCPKMDVQWTHRRIDGEHADVGFCSGCSHVHHTETYTLCMVFPYPERCAHCGGQLVLRGQQEQGKEPNPEDVSCKTCGLSARGDRELHEQLVAIHPEKDFLLASKALREQNRLVLALKLATAEVRWGKDPIQGEVQRLYLLDAMDLTDLALDEAQEWSNNPGAPSVVWGVIAQIEGGSGNVVGALAALEKGLRLAPERADWWVDYAELNLHTDAQPVALRAASKALADETTRPRALRVIVDVAERLYASEQYAQALAACSVAGEHQSHHAPLAWLRARISAVNQDTNYMVDWLKQTLALEPEHAEALAMLAPYEKKEGWFPW